MKILFLLEALAGSLSLSALEAAHYARGNNAESIIWRIMGPSLSLSGIAQVERGPPSHDAMHSAACIIDPYITRAIASPPPPRHY